MGIGRVKEGGTHIRPAVCIGWHPWEPSSVAGEQDCESDWIRVSCSFLSHPGARPLRSEMECPEERRQTMMQCHIIRTIRLAHCKRGPEVCEQCRAMDVERYCLLDICPPNPGMEQRRVIQVTVDGETEWCEFDVVKVFQDAEEAAAYAAEHGIEDTDL
jgi:hypothetical protein